MGGSGLDRTDDFQKFCWSGLDRIQFYRIRAGLGLKNFTVRSSLLSGICVRCVGWYFISWLANGQLVFEWDWLENFLATRDRPLRNKVTNAKKMSTWSIIHGRRKGVRGGLAPLGLKLLAKKFVFSISRGKTKFHHFWPPLEKILVKFPTSPRLKKSFRRPGYHMCKYNAVYNRLDAQTPWCTDVSDAQTEGKVSASHKLWLACNNRKIQYNTFAASAELAYGQSSQDGV